MSSQIPDLQKTILHIDDDPDDLELFEDVVAHIDPALLLLSFTDTLKAIEYLKNELMKPHIIFLDVNMPLLNGLDVLRSIRAIKSMTAVPVIMLSTTIVNEQMLINLGASCCLKKAWHFENMKADVTRVLSKFLK